MKLKSRNYVSLIIWIVALLFIGSSIGSLTKSSVDTWYMNLNRSPLTPPNYLFGTAWSILYAMIATSGWKIWNSNQFTGLHLIKKLYVIQLALNWSWTPLFFTYHLTWVALICMTCIIIIVALLIVKAYKNLNTAALLLIPYLLWLLFAFYLNFYISRYN